MSDPVEGEYEEGTRIINGKLEKPFTLNMLDGFFVTLDQNGNGQAFKKEYIKPPQQALKGNDDQQETKDPDLRDQ